MTPTIETESIELHDHRVTFSRFDTGHYVLGVMEKTTGLATAIPLSPAEWGDVVDLIEDGIGDFTLMHPNEVAGQGPEQEEV